MMERVGGSEGKKSKDCQDIGFSPNISMSKSGQEPFPFEFSRVVPWVMNQVCV